ncbi:MAG: NAD(P)-dependent oxidoreductase [Candidatus Margulisbacteria bacterium]|nr:NAD(P)-dependent oxidoreductase [Candidatus Margulisiibacteriota bacterium]
MQTFLVTGCTGFLGSRLVSKLLEQGQKVLGIARKPKGFLTDADLSNPEFSFYQLDLGQGLEIINQQVDGVFHLASLQPSVAYSFNDYYQGNVSSTLKVLEFCKQKNVPFLAYTSTTSVVDKIAPGQIMNEGSACVPASYYGITKYMAERLIETELQNTATKGILVRFPSLFGKNHDGGLIYTYYRAALENKNLEIYGEGKRLRNLLYIEPAVQVLLNIITEQNNLGAFEIFMAGSKNSSSMLDIARNIYYKMNCQGALIPVDKKTSPDVDILLDISKAEAQLKFQPLTIEEGIDAYLREMNHGL